MENGYGQISHTWKNARLSNRIDYIWLSQNLALNIHSFKNKEYKHITNNDHILLQAVIYGDDIIGCPKRANNYRKKSRTILDLKEMTQEKWIEYSQEVEREIVRLKLLSKIRKLKEEDLGTAIDCTNKGSNQLQKIWNELETIITKAGKKIIPIKKISRSKRPILKDKGHTPSFKDLREVTTILSIVKKIQKTKDLSLLNEIEKKINRLKKTQSLLDFESYYRDLNNIEFSWEEWKLSLKKNIKVIKEVNLREETMIREKKIKKAILKRYKDLEFNQKRIINSLTNLKKEMIILDRILVKDQEDPYISIEPKEILAETRKHYKNTFKTREFNFDLLSED